MVRRADRPTSQGRRRFLVGAGLGAAGLLAGGSVASAYRFEVVRMAAPLPALASPVRVAWLCDLHYGPFIGASTVSRWIDAALLERPDVVLLGGDLVDYHVGPDIGPLLDQIARLTAPLGVYAVWGNHDRWRFPDIAPFARALSERGVRVMVNRGAPLRDDLYLAGIDDVLAGEPDVGAALAGAPARSATLLMSHNPDALPGVPTGVGLTLCGHTHGGQVCLPLIGPIVTGSKYGRRFVQGWVRGPARGYVSRGLGVSTLPVRVDCPAELTVLDLTPSSRAGRVPAGGREGAPG